MDNTLRDLFKYNNIYSVMDELTCSICNILCRDKYDMKRHLVTVKHLNKIDDISRQKILGKFKCHICSKLYKYQSGLSKHTKKHIEYDEDTDNNDVMENFVKQQFLLIESQQEVMKKMNTLVDNNNTSQHIHQNHGIINNKININVFLNNNCKDAMNLMDFIENLQLTIEDLCVTQQLGYVNGMSQILSKNLENLKPTERPIHCDNGNKNIQFYIKDKDQWEEDVDMNKLDKGLETLSRKQIEVLKEWAVAHPNWMKCENETQIYMEMVKQCMGGSNLAQTQKNKEDIKKAIGKEVSINDVIEL
jgi:hypothetical protein